MSKININRAVQRSVAEFTHKKNASKRVYNAYLVIYILSVFQYPRYFCIRHFCITTFLNYDIFSLCVFLFFVIFLFRHFCFRHFCTFDSFVFRYYYYTTFLYTTFSRGINLQSLLSSLVLRSREIERGIAVFPKRIPIIW